MAPSHELRGAINEHIRERLAREGTIQGPAFQGSRLVSHGYTRAEKALAANYARGDVVAFHRPYKRLGVEKGDERRVVEIDGRSSTVMLEGKDGGTVVWKPGQVAGRNGGTEVYRIEGMELGPATACAGPATTGVSGSSTVEPPRWSRQARTGSRFGSRTVGRSHLAEMTRSYATSIMPGHRRCMRFRGARWTM